VRKLALYARGKETVELDYVLAAVADASALVIDGVIDAAFAGRTAEVAVQFAKARAAGTPPGRLVTTALARVSELHRGRLAIEAGTPFAAVVEEIAPRAQFRRRPAAEAALKAWTASRLERVMAELAAAALDSRRLSGSAAALAEPVVSRVLMMIAISARRRS